MLAPKEIVRTEVDAVFLAVGDSALSVQFGLVVDPEVNRKVSALAQCLAAKPIAGVLECVPTYRSLLVSYDPAVVRGAALEQSLTQRIAHLELATEETRLWAVPVVYGGTVGLDLEAMAQEKGMTPEHLVEVHSGAEYQVYMIGFAPGFAYLGGLPKVLHTPRLSAPRQSIPAGAIGIGGQQASVNSVAGPSGWRFVGWTPWKTFDLSRETPFLFMAGDRIKFVPVSRSDGMQIAREISDGIMTPMPMGLQ